MNNQVVVGQVTVEELPSHHHNEFQPTVLSLERDQARINRIMYAATTHSNGAAPQEQAVVVAASSDRVSNNTNTRCWIPSRRRQYYLLGGLLMLIVLAVILTFTVPHKKEDTSWADQQANKAAEQAYFRDRFVVLRTLLGNYSKPYLFYNPDSAQTLALQWLVFRDNTLNHREEDEFRMVQRYAYLVLYFSCGGANWNSFAKGEITKMEESVISSHECDFLGITCNSQKHVTRVELVDQDLVGPLPQEIGLFTNLKHLDLSDNTLRGKLPDTIGKLTNLESLKLSSNDFWGPVTAQAIGPLKRLQSISLYGNRFSGALPAKALQGLKEVLSFDVARNFDLEGSVVEIAVAAPWSKLTVLSLSQTRTGGTIPNDIDTLSNLEVFSVGKCDLVGTIPDALTNLKKMKAFFIWADDFQNATFPTGIGKLSKLEELALISRGMGGTIPTSIGLLTDLTHFVAGYSDIVGSIPTHIGLLTNLILLDLMGSPITGNLPSEIGNLNKLDSIYIWQTKMEGKIPDSVCSMQKLTMFQYPCRMTCDCCVADCNQEQNHKNKTN